jgi:cysteine desulfurase
MKMKTIYLDNAATTPVRAEVLAAMKPYFSEKYGNPSSLHCKGQEAALAIKMAREKIADILGCGPDEIIFTSGGTESVNLAIKGFALANKNKGKHIITQKTEHHAVLETCKWLEKQGFSVTYLDVDEFGLVNPRDVEKAITDKTILISIMFANNEIGTIQPIREIAEICIGNNVVLHTDACQAAGYYDLEVHELGTDLLTLNGSKIYGPKGIGVLYAKKGMNLVPLIHGGEQEKGLRAGTENVPAIVGLAKALELAQKEREKESKRLMTLRDNLIRGLLKIPQVKLNGHPSKRLPNNIDVLFSGVEGEAIVFMLSEKGICASTGSACSSKKLEPSHVLLAIGRKPEEAHGSVRLTLGRETTEKDISYVLKVMPEIIAKLRKMSPVWKMDCD